MSRELLNLDALRTLIEETVRKVLAEQQHAPEYLSTAEAARVAAVAQKTIQRWIQAGHLTAHYAGRQLRVERADLERWLRDGPPRLLSPEEYADRKSRGA